MSRPLNGLRGPPRWHTDLHTRTGRLLTQDLQRKPHGQRFVFGRIQPQSASA